MSDTMSGTVNGPEDTVGGAEGTPQRHPNTTPPDAGLCAGFIISGG